MPAAISPTIRRPARGRAAPARSSPWCERMAQGARNSGRVVATMSSGACAPRSASDLRRSSVVGSAQCRSSKASTAGCVRAPAKYHAVTAAICRRRNSSGANFAERASGNAISTSGAIRGAYSSGSRPTAVECSRGRRDAPRRSRRRRRSAVCPIRRSGAGACSAAVAKRPIRPRCAVSPRVFREIPRSGATCRCRARRRSGRTDPRLRRALPAPR